MDEFTGKVAVVTGAASGIGLALAERFAAEGMKVVLADIDPELPALESRLREQGTDAVAMRTDVSDSGQVDALAARAVEAFGTVHVVCNNAGTGGPCAFGDLELADWQFQLGVNLWGVINGVRAFLPILRAQDEGHIVNTASMGGLIHGPYIAPYNVSKAGIVALTETVSNELALEGSAVGISVLCPGAVNTNMNNESNVPAERKMAARPASPAIEGLRQALVTQLSEHGLSPASVAETVIAAIRDRRVHILTNPEFIPLVQQRFQTIIGEGPGGGPIDLEEMVELAEKARG
jgi:NAD(P)-dependent dehydrogenase (short-subunit alcohol dehydrogenase family)